MFLTAILKEYFTGKLERNAKPGVSSNAAGQSPGTSVNELSFFFFFHVTVTDVLFNNAHMLPLHWSLSSPS